MKRAREPTPNDRELLELRSLLRRVGRRYRVLDAVWRLTSWAWLGAASAVAILIIARLQPIADDRLIALLLAAGGLLAATAGPLVRPRSSMEVALRADSDLGLEDRLATAVSYSAAADDSSGLVGRQRSDALRAAEALDPARDLPVRADRRRLALAAVVGAMALGLAALPNPQHEVLAQREQVEEAALKEAERVEEVRRALQDEDALTDEEREALDAALARLRDRLRETDGKAVEALADIAAAEAELRKLRDEGAVRKGRAAMSLAQSLDRLARSSGPGASSGEGDPAEGLAELAEKADELSAEELQNLAEQLEELSLTGSGTAPEAAQALEDLAAALRSGDAAGARQAAEQAARALDDAASASAGPAAVEGALSQLQQSRQRVASAAAGESGALAGITSGAGAGSLGYAAGSGGGPGASGSGETDESREVGGGEGSASGSGLGDGACAGSGSCSGGEAADGTGGGSGAGGGFGRSGESQPGARTGATSSDTGRVWEAVAAPQEWREGWSTLVYAPLGESPAGPAEFVPGRLPDAYDGRLMRERETRSEGASGPALVPYEDVYARYSRAAGEAMARETIPRRLRDYVREYFAQLEPR